MKRTTLAATDPLRVGFPYTVDPRLLGNQQTIQLANRTFYFRVTGAGPVSKLGLYVQTSSGNVCLSVYANSGSGRSAAPGARVATTGSIACPALGYAEPSLGSTVAVTHMDFWFALACDNLTAMFASFSSNAWAVQGLAAWQDSAFPSPSTPTPANGAGGGGGSRLFGLIGVA